MKYLLTLLVLFLCLAEMTQANPINHDNKLISTNILFGMDTSKV